jgi:LPXTG-site transpeptidase (sortase) family protein
MPNCLSLFNTSLRASPRTQLLAILLCLTMMLYAHPVPGARAATITVTNRNDSGAGSLRQAIATAAPGETIDFSVTGIITLSSGQLTIDKNLTITGPGESNLTISGGGSSRIFEIASGPYDVNISGLTIADGYIFGVGGGMVNTSTGAVLLENVTFNANDAFEGSGLYNFSNNPTLINVTFTNNTAVHYGAGMYNANSNPTLDNVTFDNNWADWGGGMANWSSSPTMTNVTFSGNYAEFEGGGMHNHDSSPTLSNVTFHNNTTGLNGGGMYNHTNSNPILTNVTFDTNSAVLYGGGMYNNLSRPTLTTNVSFNFNFAEHGGGMYNDSSSPTMTNVTFSNNSAIDNGGGMYNFQSNPTLIQVTISGNTADRGGGIDNDDSNPTLTNTILAGNSASTSGPDCSGTINSGDYNLIGDSTDCTFMTDPNDQVGTALDPLNPLLAPLANNGGETQTRALQTGSPAIDWIPNGVNGCGTTITSDQRGEVRPFPTGGDCDIGAYEFNTPTELPETGFAPGRITSLPEQPANKKAYNALGHLLLEVPKLGIQAPIVSVPVVENIWNVSWLDNNVGYLQGSAFPTWQGNTVLTAHVWDAYNQPGLFIDLKQMSYGDRVVIHAWGLEYLYEVRENRLVSPNDVNAVVQHKEFDWVTLVTCENYRFDVEGYAFRRMVQAVLVDINADP